MRIVLRTFALALLLPVCALGQESDTGSAYQRDGVLQAARDVMEGARYCTLVTIGENGHPQARIVDPFPPDERMVVWIATRPTTRKVGQIRSDARVTLLCFDAQRLGYVSLMGSAELVDDPEEKTSRWKDEWADFYSDRNRGDDYLLIRVQPDRLEILSPAHGIVNDPRTWLPVVTELK
jgi:general stress protein 26